MAYIICWRSGEVEVVDRLGEDQPGVIVLATGERDELTDVLSSRARHASDGKTLLVPGLPEAQDSDQAVEAAARFREQLEEHLGLWPDEDEEER